VLVAAAVCPHPPLLVPELAAGAAGELDRLRTACDGAVSALLAVDTDLLVVVGDAPAAGPFAEGAWGSLSPYGVEITTSPRSGNRGSDPSEPSLPLSLTIGQWLLGRHDVEPVDTLYFGVSPDADAARCAQIGSALASRVDRVTLLVMGDASARRSLKGPGYLDERAPSYDASVARALADADTDALLALDPSLSAELLVAGRAPWQLLAGAAEGGTWSARVMFDEAPYGVTYLVATWTNSATTA
jgi:hypothetical protein